jgi:hypothetical protein
VTGVFLELLGYGAAEKCGEQRILREVAKLPSPIARTPKLIGGEWEHVRLCRWCHAVMADPAADWHPDNGCLWPRAQAAAKEDA